MVYRKKNDILKLGKGNEIPIAPTPYCKSEYDLLRKGNGIIVSKEESQNRPRMFCREYL